MAVVFSYLYITPHLNEKTVTALYVAGRFASSYLERHIRCHDHPTTHAATRVMPRDALRPAMRHAERCRK